jgi:hypothetical protein
MHQNQVRVVRLQPVEIKRTTNGNERRGRFCVRLHSEFIGRALLAARCFREGSVDGVAVRRWMVCGVLVDVGDAKKKFKNAFPLLDLMCGVLVQ